LERIGGNAVGFTYLPPLPPPEKENAMSVMKKFIAILSLVIVVVLINSQVASGQG
jgi:hypothetical protein